MVDIQRRAVLRSLEKSASTASAASTATVRSPHMYQSKVSSDTHPLAAALDASDAAFFHALASAPPAAYEFGSPALASLTVPTAANDDADALFAAYPPAPPAHELDASHWDLYYSGATSSATPTTPTAAVSPASGSSHAGRGALRPTSTSTAPRQGVKRPLSTAPQPSPTTAVASSMLAMRLPSDVPTTPPTPKPKATPRRTVSAKKDDSSASSSSETEPPAAKKTKVSRERQLKINAASRRCRKKQKLELQFLRTHVVDLQSALKDQVTLLRTSGSDPSRVARLASFLEESIRHVEDMSSGGRPGSTPKASLYSEAELQQLKATAEHARAQAAKALEAPAPKAEATETDDHSGMSAERRQTLLHIASFMRNNISLESQSFSPEVISCLPIEMDGWQLRLAITEKNYTIHNAKFFPYDVQDMFDFCWDTNVAAKTSIKQGKNDYCVVTPLDADVAHVYSKTIGKWSLAVHGVANVSYNSLVCRTFAPETRRAMICQQSVLEDRDFQDESTIPWLFKRWVVFQPRTVDGVEGTYVEAYRTASYATGRLIYKEDNTYDSFCEHLIRRYAESNSLLERTMARDPRFQHVADPAAAAACDAAALLDHEEETTSDHMVKDLLLF